MEITISADEIPDTTPELLTALGEAGLPVEDISFPGRHFFRFHDQKRLIGFVGYEEIGGAAALLRSLVVLPPERGKGYGTQMAEWVLARLAERGFADAWMLTEAAQRLGFRLGFVRAIRDQAPDDIRATHQFTTLCASSATLMHKNLG
jgi:N-acetylglutamate synthase-like GNAT family acetyltransferase